LKFSRVNVRLALFCLVYFCFSSAIVYCQPQSQTLKLKGRVDELAMFASMAGMKLSSSQFEPGKTKVEAVRNGSSAYYCGIQSGDLLSNIQASEDFLKIEFKRAGKTYSSMVPIKLSVYRRKLKEGISDPQPGPVNKSIKSGLNFNDTMLKALAAKLSHYRIVFLIDRSDSMDGGLRYGRSDISRFTYLRQELQDFSGSVLPLLGDKKSVSVITFNEDFEEKEIADSAGLTAIFDGLTPEGATNFSKPFSYVFEKYKSQPLLVILFSDGFANRGESVDQLIARASKEIDLSICIFQIGKDEDGEKIIKRLDSSLESLGAERDVVSVKDFSYLFDHGLKAALYELLRAAN
jgi:hypothetical protein